MANTARRRDVTPAIQAALAHVGLTPRRIVLISRLVGKKGGGGAYRVDSDDGRTIKVRQFDSAAAARDLLALRAGLEDAFAPALAQYDCVLLEEWIDGTPLAEGDPEVWAEEAGALLGRLHARALGPDVPARTGTGEWITRGLSDLETLAGGGELTGQEVTTLRSEILRRDPGSARAALIHMDFCAENMLIDTRGRLRVVDNEHLMIAPASFDVGRTFDRWPMSDPAWARFYRAYRSSAPADIDAIGFWKILAALMGARVRFQHSPARLTPALALLHRFIRGDGLADPC